MIDYNKKINFGGTDCSLPMIWAEENQLSFDVFIVYTDSGNLIIYMNLLILFFSFQKHGQVYVFIF